MSPFTFKADWDLHKVLAANGLLVLFPVVSAHIVRELGPPGAAVDFLLVLSFINLLGLLDLGMLRSIVLRQDLRGGWVDVVLLSAVTIAASSIALESSSNSIGWVGIAAAVVYFFGGMLKALFERDQLLLQEAKHRFWTALSVFTSAITLVISGFFASMLVMLTGKAVVVWSLGRKRIGGYLKVSGVPRVNLLVGTSSVAAFVVLLSDRVLASETLAPNAAAAYLFYGLLLQRLVAVFGSLLPRYLTKSGVSSQEFVIPGMFGAAMFCAVLGYAHFFEREGLGHVLEWLPILTGAYFINVITVPFLGRNLVAGRHAALALSYSVQLIVFVGFVFGIGASQTSLAIGVFARSALDFFWQRRLAQVGNVVLP